MQKMNLPLPAFLLFVLTAVVSTGLMRYVSFEVPVLSNCTPLGALALFGGAYFTDKWKAVLTVVIVLFITNIFINYLYVPKLVFWTSGSLPVYISFVAMVFIGGLMQKINITNVLLASLATVALHWLITDIDPWLNSPYYSKGVLGYFESLLMALPFERNMLIADIVFGSVLFGSLEWLKSRNKSLHQKPRLVIK